MARTWGSQGDLNRPDPYALPACEQSEPVSCETCGDFGWVDARIGQDTLASVQCPDCTGQTPAFIPGHDDVPLWMQDGDR